MKFKWYKQLSLVIVIAMLISALPVYAASSDERDLLSEAIEEAKVVTEKDIALVTAIELAVKALENENSSLPQLVDLTDRLNELVSINDDVLDSLRDIKIDYVKSSDLITSFNDTFSSYLSNVKVYEADGQSYLRLTMKAQPSINLAFTVEGKAGTVAQYVDTNVYVYDYKISSIEEPVLGLLSYKAGAHVGMHDHYIVIDQDATAEDRTGLKNAIAAATAIEKDGKAAKKLLASLTAAKKVNNLITRNAELIAATVDLNAAISANLIITDEDQAAFEVALGNAKAVEDKDVALVTAIEQAEKAAENEKTILAELEFHADRLNELVAINEEVKDSLRDVTTIDYVKSSDLITSFNSTFSKYLSNVKVYEAAGQSYLRVTMKTDPSINLSFTIEGKVGAVAQVVETNVYVYDYKISSIEEPVLGSLSYKVGTHVGLHDHYIVIDQDATTEDRTALKNAIAAATAIQKDGKASKRLVATLTDAMKLSNLITRKAELIAATTDLNAAISANLIITNEDRQVFDEALEVAKAVEGKDIALVTAIGQAENAAENNATILAELEFHADRLNKLVSNNNKIISSLRDVTTIDYVKSSNLTELYNTMFNEYFSNVKVYEVDGQSYLRITIKNEPTKNLTFTVEGKAGSVSQYGENNVNTYDYKISSTTEPLLSSFSVTVDGASSTEQYLVINQDAIAADRVALKKAITTAEAVTNKKEALVTAIANAKKVDNLLTRKAVLNAQTTALTAAIAANGTTAPPTNVEIHEGSGLEVGKYTIPLTVYTANGKEISIMNGYVAADARLQVTKNSLKVYVLMTDASMIKSLEVDGKKASVAERYKADDVARYSFEVSSLTGLLSGSVHVVAVLDGVEIYDTTHDISIGFGSPSKVDKWEDEGYSKGDPTTPGTGTEQPGGTGTDTGTGSNGGESNGNNGGSTNPTPKFTDIDNSWAKAAIERAVALKLVTGYTDGTFKPNQEVNRAEFTAIIVRAMKLEAAKGEVKFADADKIQGWAKEFIQQAVEAGILTGYNDNTFRPTGNITRTEAAVMIVRALGLELVSEDELTFADASNIPAYARAYVATAVKYGLVVGYSNNTFGPEKVATRADAITLALRALDYKASHK
ncbi:S-layer homology domain-containing protein [Paenibacillus endoradicis]|uniref:S-layer homology domain-containing protein n=1 Tax=Paenibacillus endoradicis TaxID=2972487 RepID=UPI0021596E40|nr:S-layer homology domain-containing protein [Paenibacillus endoradicis]MCR8656037.1 S-layer homology domain-containing protein [Paenibacillus endoradicis]MCR8658363.1 S-layer homology domain-containing protein [Paenibacillus endoradicis]